MTVKRLVIVKRLHKLLRHNEYKHVHFGSFKKDSQILISEVILVIDCINDVWLVYTTERGVFTTMKVFEHYSALAEAIKNKQL